MQYFSIIQQTQGIGTIAVPFSDTVGIRDFQGYTLLGMSIWVELRF